MPNPKIKAIPHEQMERNELLVEYHEKHPSLTYQQLGCMFRITKARAYQIIHRIKSRKEECYGLKTA